MTNEGKTRLEEVLRGLRLYRYYPYLLEELTKLDSSYSDVSEKVIGILDKIQEFRKEDRVKRLLTDSGLPLRYLNSAYSLEESRAEKLDKVKDLFKLSWIEDGANVFISGTSQTGKTHLATALSQAAINSKEYNVYFISATKLFDRLATEEANSPEQLKLLEVKVLVIDDIGHERIEMANIEPFYQLIAERYKACRPTMITSGMSIETWFSKLDSTAESLMNALIKISSSSHKVTMQDNPYFLSS